MKVPSDAQARFLDALAAAERSGDTVELVLGQSDRTYGGANAYLVVEVIDREANTASLQPFHGGYAARRHRTSTVQACIRNGWLSNLHERTVTRRPTKWEPRGWEGRLQQLDTTEDGVIALGLWRERKLQAPPAPLPTLTEREREVLALAHRALELGYALCARKPARTEARKLRRDGWAGECWVANQASGIVPSPMAICEVLPEHADHVQSAEA